MDMSDCTQKNYSTNNDAVTEIQYVKGVGPARAKEFARLGVSRAADLLEYYPRNWVFPPKSDKIRAMTANREGTVRGIIEGIDVAAWSRPPRLEAYLADDTGVIKIVWFHGAYLQKQLTVGMEILLWGKVTRYKGQLQFTNPKFRVIEAEEHDDESKLGGAVYPATANLSSRQINRIIKPVVKKLAKDVDEFFDTEYLRKRKLIERPKAFEWIHLAVDQDQVDKAKRRLKYDELFLMQAALALRRYRTENFMTASAMNIDDKIDSRIRRRFPFLLTEDQNNVISEIVSDMTRTIPMNRLLQGDVGSGKTVVALYAALTAVANKTQAAIMAPTEILANQHFLSIERYLNKSRVKRAVLTGGLAGRKREKLLREIEQGHIDIVVGTVALLQGDIKFRNLGLVVIDEQHKFGVHQRALLRKETSPHCLVMTATPIPRTLAMTAFGDLDVSIIKHCPPGRGKVITRRVNPENRTAAFDFIRKRLRAKKQAYFVYPRISTTEDESELKAAVDEYHRLSENEFADFRVGLLHGRMKSDEKEQTMQEFRKGKIDVLVATVVIEVGVDVPNATIMVIEGADRFGLAQLHQLRGRIGRGQSNSYCLLFSDSETEVSAKRLEVMERTNDGFVIAEEDLRLRGPGELLSARQHGMPDLKIADIIEDSALLLMSRRDAAELINRDPRLENGPHRNIRRALIQKFAENLGLVDIG